MFLVQVDVFSKFNIPEERQHCHRLRRGGRVVRCGRVLSLVKLEKTPSKIGKLKDPLWASGNKYAPTGWISATRFQLDERGQRVWGMGCFANSAFTCVLALAYFLGRTL